MSRWIDWHRAYDDTDGPLTRRLGIVQQLIADALDDASPGPVRVISICAGDGRDLLGVLPHHPRGRDVRGRLVELDPELAARARAAAPEGIEVACGDASTTSAYAGAVPADLVLACGIFGNIGDGDIVGTVNTLPSLCATGATVVWTRHRRPPDRTVLVRDTFAAAGFAEVEFAAADDFLFGVGAHRFTSQPPPFVSGIEMFAFVGFDALDGRCSECGFVYDLTRAETVRRLTDDAELFAAQIRALDGDSARRRPSPDVWSPLEYACHVRDMLDVQRGRVELIQRQDSPELVPMGRDERVIEHRYNEQDPRIVTSELLTAAAALVASLAAIDDDGWTRTGVYTYPTTELRTVAWIGTHTVHELQHHRRDISTESRAAS
jgi:DinB superfamily